MSRTKYSLNDIRILTRLWFATGVTINTGTACCANIINGAAIAKLSHGTETLVPGVRWYR